MVYADFESLAKPIDKQKWDNTHAYQEHEPCGLQNRLHRR